MKSILISICLATLLTGCVAYQTGTTTQSTAGEKIIYTDIAVGTSQTNRFFGFGGMRKDALILEARRQMITARPLQINEEYQNVTTDIKHSFVLMVHRIKVTISADVVTHVQDLKGERYSKMYKEKLFQTSPFDSLLQAGTQIITEQGKKGTILQNLKSSKSIVLLANKKGEIITRKRRKAQLYVEEGSWNSYNVGQNVTLKLEMLPTLKGTVIGINRKGFLIQDSLGKFSTTEFDEIRSIEQN